MSNKTLYGHGTPDIFYNVLHYCKVKRRSFLTATSSQRDTGQVNWSQLRAIKTEHMIEGGEKKKNTKRGNMSKRSVNPEGQLKQYARFNFS